MADNTLLNAGTGGDTIRDVAKTVNSPAKTQMMILDVGGATDASTETALVLGQATKSASLPVTLASDQGVLSVTTTNGALAANQPALNADGGALAHVTNFPATQPVSAASLPLPAGAAVSALQPALNADGGALAHVTNFPATQPVSAAALPLPANAAQETGGNLATIAAALAGALTTQPAAHTTTANSTSGTLTAGTAANILPANASRRKVVVTNNGSATMFLSWYGAAAANVGIQVAAGASYFDDNPFNTALSAYCASANAYTVQEG